MRIYLCGPMSGIPLFNHPAFDEAAARWRAAGHEVYSPAEADRENGITPAADGSTAGVDYGACIRRCIGALLECDAVATLRFSTQSVGACLEVTVALALGLPVYLGHAGDPSNPVPTCVSSGGQFGAISDAAHFLSTAARRRSRKESRVKAEAGPA